MQAVHFGAGNIGRGFIGALLDESGYETVFLDVNGAVIDELNKKRQYDVNLLGKEQSVQTVKNVRGINSQTMLDQAAEAISNADLVTAAVGPNVLPAISGLIAEGLKIRLLADPEPLNIIACENMINGSSVLKDHVYKHLSESEQKQADKLFGFPNAAVDRIVPDQSNENLLDVSVEPYFEWVVERPAVKGEVPDIKGITYVDQLTPYIERKLFTVNTGHAVPAYFGRYKGHQTIFEAMQDPEVEKLLQQTLAETGEVVIREHGFDRSEHEAYIQKIIERFRNPHISDHVTRVGRGPIRKLDKNDRLLRPAVLYLESTGKEPDSLATVIAAALLYRSEEDAEAVTLSEMISEKGYEAAFREVSGLAEADPLLSAVMKKLELMQ